MAKIKLKDQFEERELKYLSSQMKEAIAQEILNNLKSLKQRKDNGKKIGKLKFTSKERPITLKQFSVTFKFLNKQKSKMKIQGYNRTFRVLGGHQIPKVAEIKTAKIIKKPSGYYLHITCFIPKEKYIESWENIQTKKHNFKHREWVSFDKPIGIDFKPNGMVLSNGIEITWKVLESKKLKKLQRMLSKKTKGSNRYKKLKQRVSKEYMRITNQKRDVINKVTSLLYRYRMIVYQDDNFHAWHKTFLSKSIQHSSIGGITRRLSSNVEAGIPLLK